MKNITYISAGAGSGKTTRIIKELVAAINSGVKPSQIIMTTFTRAAAQEMRERAKQKLLELGQPDKANEMDAAMIGTIHSVCLSFLQKYWYLAGISPETQQMDENDFKLYVDRSLFENVSEKDMQDFERWRKVLDLKKKDSTSTKPYVNYWREWLRTMVDKVRYYQINDLTESRERSIQEIEDVWSRNGFDQAEYERCKQAYIDVMSGNGRLKKRVEYVSTYNPIEKKGEIEKNYREYKVDENIHKAWMTAAAKAAFTDDAKKAMIAIVNKLFDVLGAWKEEYATYKKQHKMLDFNDMEVEFCQLLEHEEVQAELMQYKLVLVDEFQDCNPMQVDIFSRISDIVERSIWVGDPKQAIYGFRGTDTTLVKEVSDQIKENVDGCHRETLPANYRSRPALVEQVNDMFMPVFDKAPFFLNEEEITLESKRADVLGEQPHCIEWTTTSKFENLAHEIYELVDGEKKICVQPKGTETSHPAQYGDIAILVRKNSTIAKIANALRAQGVPFFAPEAKDANATPIEEALLMALMQYHLSAKYRSHLRADILHLMKNIATDELVDDYLYKISVSIGKDGKRKYDGKAEWKQDDELIQQIDAISKEYYAKPVYETMCAFVDRLNLYNLAAQWGDAEIRRSNISGLLRLAKSYDDHCKILEIAKPTYADFAKYMEEADAKTELNMTSNSVKILTMHKSKGLEWPIVVYYDKDNSFADDDSIISKEFFGIREQRKDKRAYWLRVFPSAGCDSTMSPMLMTESYFEASKTRICADEERLRYVSLTRARDMLITVAIDKEAPVYEQQDGTQKYQYIDTQATRRKGSELTYAINPSKAKRPKADYKTEIMEAKCISLHMDVLPTTMSAIGTCIHTVYAAYDPEKDKEASIRMAQTIIESYSVQAAIRADEVIEAIESLYAYLSKTYGAPTATKHELPFAHLSENGQLVHGEMDLLWYTKDGVVLVDYKNTKKEEPNPEVYMGQLAAYSEAIKSAGLTLRGAVLYYATLGKIITLNS